MMSHQMQRVNEQHKENFQFIKKPVIVEIFPTMQCNVNCPYCDRADEESILEDFDHVRMLMKKLKEDSRFSLLKFRITGREPTLYPRINELISLLAEYKASHPIDFLTNGLKVDVLTEESFKAITLAVSIYPQTKRMLAQNAELKSLFASPEYRTIAVDIKYHEDLKHYGTERNDFNPFSDCFSPTLLCGSRKVYPCCRAHLYEAMYGGAYHACLDEENLFDALKNIIQTKDVCSRCPRVFKNPVIKPVI